MRRVGGFLAWTSVLCCAGTIPDAIAQTAPTVAAPEHLAAAEAVARKILPDGSYAVIMEASMGMAMDGAMQSVGNLPLKDLAAIGGMEPDDLAGMGSGTLKDLMTIVDPVFEERNKRSMAAMTKSMTRMMTSMEPSVRDGLAQAFARRYSPAELQQLLEFFATPTGAKFARDTLQIYVDPAVMAKMQEMMPKVVEQMPAMVREMQAATADLPKPRAWKDLSADEKRRFAELVGTSVEEIDGRQAELEEVNDT